jgi:opacity protein-like surface antigen
MKKVLIISTWFFFMSTISYGQFTKGRVLMGGSFSASANSNKYSGLATTKSWNVSLYPQVGYFVANNFAAGLGLQLGHSSFKSTSTFGKSTFNSIYFEPFARYYFHNFYAQAAFQLGSTKQETKAPNASESKMKSTGWTVAAGYAYMLNEHVAIEPQLGYNVLYPDSGSSPKQTNGSLFLKIGVQVYIGKSK